MRIDRDQLIRRVAEKHRLVLTEDDPLIASVTLHEVIFESHSQQLMQQMEEQNAKALAALHSTLHQARSDQKREHEHLIHVLNAFHHKTLEDYRQITENCLASLQILINEARSAKQSAKAYVGVGTFFGILFFCANLYVLLKH